MCAATNGSPIVAQLEGVTENMKKLMNWYCRRAAPESYDRSVQCVKRNSIDPADNGFHLILFYLSFIHGDETQAISWPDINTW